MSSSMKDFVNVLDIQRFDCDRNNYSRNATEKIGIAGQFAKAIKITLDTPLLTRDDKLYNKSVQPALNAGNNILARF